ncbi:MAG: hypothetical protein LUF92_03695 [Clostridiales bacterium]|nr:hypothetical protein [Clostridiales bacterium]
MKNTVTEENKVQYILDEHGCLRTMLKSDAIPVENPVKYKLKNAFEVFVPVKKTENYWISNYGRLINNMNIKKKDKYYEHKKGKHYTIFEISYFRTKQGERTREKTRRETSPAELVAETFLIHYPNRYCVWHKDGDTSNNYYKNLIYVSKADYDHLKNNQATWQELNLVQDYKEYINKSSAYAMQKYGMIKSRCTNGDSCYQNATMCQEWLDNPESFVLWYLLHYYEVDNESMAVDKDLFGGDSKGYSPENCCVLPQELNTMLSNCHKRYINPSNDLPLAVSKSDGKYHATITFMRSNKAIRLSDWDTPEEAFAEYKLMKESDICIMAAYYKDKIPDYIYRKLLVVEVKPY